MKTPSSNIFLLCAIIALSGCANQTTDPHQGGLFSYNPNAYEQRLRDRRDHLATVEQSTQTEQAQSSALEAEQTSQLKKKAAVEKQVKKLSASIVSLEKEIKAKQTKTAGQDQERQRILAELKIIKSSTKTADAIEDPEEQRLELERLKNKRDRLEKEAANLMRL